MTAVGDVATGLVETEDALETFYKFTWAGRAARPQTQGKGGERPRGKGKPKGKGQGPRSDKPQRFSAKPKNEKRIDPDNPFAAALAGFKKE